MKHFLTDRADNMTRSDNASTSALPCMNGIRIGFSCELAQQNITDNGTWEKLRILKGELFDATTGCDGSSVVQQGAQYNIALQCIVVYRFLEVRSQL